MSYERSVYESVDDSSLFKVISRISMKKKNLVLKGLIKTCHLAEKIFFILAINILSVYMHATLNSLFTCIHHFTYIKKLCLADRNIAMLPNQNHLKISNWKHS